LHDLAKDPTHAETIVRLRESLGRWRSELDDTQDQGSTFWAGYDAG